MLFNGAKVAASALAMLLMAMPFGVAWYFDCRPAPVGVVTDKLAAAETTTDVLLAATVGSGTKLYDELVDVVVVPATVVVTFVLSK